MTERFFTNALTASGALAGTERIPFDLPGGGSEFLTPAQIESYSEPLVIAALKNLRSSTGKYSTDSSASGFTATAGQITLASNASTSPFMVVLDLTGALAAGANLQLPTVSSVMGVLSQGFTGQSWILRILNNSSAAFSWTVVTNTGWTLNGTMSLAQSTSRDFLITITDAGGALASLQNIGSGGV